MFLIIRLSIFCILFFGCDEVGQFINKGEKKKITYSFACLDSTFSGKPINRKLEKASDILRDLAISKKSITDEYVCMMKSVSKPDEELFRKDYDNFFRDRLKGKTEISMNEFRILFAG